LLAKVGFLNQKNEQVCVKKREGKTGNQGALKQPDHDKMTPTLETGLNQSDYEYVPSFASIDPTRIQSMLFSTRKLNSIYQTLS
jgi:hypothetical protein